MPKATRSPLKNAAQPSYLHKREVREHNRRVRRRQKHAVVVSKSASAKKKVSPAASGGGRRDRVKDAEGGGGGGVTKKRRRFRPGTKAMMEMIDLQSGKHSTTNLLRRGPMYNLIREVMQEFSDYRLTASCVSALIQASQEEMNKQFECAQLMAIQGGRVTIEPKDLIVANQLRSIHPAKPHMPYDPTKIYKFRSDGPKKRNPDRL